jgi:hypothetical protein
MFETLYLMFIHFVECFEHITICAEVIIVEHITICAEVIIVLHCITLLVIKLLELLHYLVTHLRPFRYFLCNAQER